MIVYTTGASLKPALVNGEWRWIVKSFNEDVFVDGDCVNVLVMADTEEELISEEENYNG